MSHLRIIDSRGERKICREHRIAFTEKCSKCQRQAVVSVPKHYTMSMCDMQRWYELQWGAEARKVAR